VDKSGCKGLLSQTTPSGDDSGDRGLTDVGGFPSRWRARRTRPPPAEGVHLAYPPHDPLRIPYRYRRPRSLEVLRACWRPSSRACGGM